jgi:hypothetical protein
MGSFRKFLFIRYSRRSVVRWSVDFPRVENDDAKLSKSPISVNSKIAEWVPLPAIRHPFSGIPICETYLQFQEKSSGREIRPLRVDLPGFFWGGGVDQREGKRHFKLINCRWTKFP